jgi:indolepyruvate ferredoxin oxidoreductase beta subunit
MTDIKNVLLAGVGGQGILLASEILSEALMLDGHDVKRAEVHGMAQRGGSVVSHVRYGKKVLSPTIADGTADVLFGFELLETCRYLSLLKKGGQVIVNNVRIAPPSVALGQQEYPEDIPGLIRSRVDDLHVVNGMELAEQAGDMRTVNVVLIGALSLYLDLDKELWVKAIKAMVPERFLDLNLRAFELGRESGITD